MLTYAIKNIATLSLTFQVDIFLIKTLIILLYSKGIKNLITKQTKIKGNSDSAEPYLASELVGNSLSRSDKER